MQAQGFIWGPILPPQGHYANIKSLKASSKDGARFMKEEAL